MKLILVILFELFLCICLLGCQGSPWGKSEPIIAGGQLARDATTLPFDSIAIHGPFDVNIHLVPQQYYINYTGNASLVNLVSYYVQDKVLHVLTNPGFLYNPHLKMMLSIEVPTVKRLHYQGSGNVRLTNIDVDHFIADIDGSGYVYLAGHANRFDAQVTGSSHLDAKALTARVVFVNTDDFAQAEILSHGQISALSGGNSDIYYYENPGLVAQHETYSGSVMRMLGIAMPNSNYVLPMIPSPHGSMGTMSPVSVP
jgi:hypothetical protein